MKIDYSKKGVVETITGNQNSRLSSFDTPTDPYPLYVSAPSKYDGFTWTWLKEGTYIQDKINEAKILFDAGYKPIIFVGDGIYQEDLVIQDMDLELVFFPTYLVNVNTFPYGSFYATQAWYGNNLDGNISIINSTANDYKVSISNAMLWASSDLETSEISISSLTGSVDVFLNVKVFGTSIDSNAPNIFCTGTVDLNIHDSFFLVFESIDMAGPNTNLRMKNSMYWSYVTNKRIQVSGVSSSLDIDNCLVRCDSATSPPIYINNDQTHTITNSQLIIKKGTGGTILQFDPTSSGTVKLFDCYCHNTSMGSTAATAAIKGGAGATVEYASCAFYNGTHTKQAAVTATKLSSSIV